MSKIISFECPNKLLKLLDDYAKVEERKRSDIIRKILKDKLE